MIKQAVRLYGRSVLAGVLGTFIYLSIGVMVSVAVPRGDALSGTASFLMNLISLLLQGTIFFIFIYNFQFFSVFNYFIIFKKFR